jgi:dolichyl-phosphate-mannose-protein mannosyltransferase
MPDSPAVKPTLMIVSIVVFGAVLRLINLSGQSVEHFDEGVYSSVLWYDAMAGEAWPYRGLYAPPMLSWCIELVSYVPGLADYAPFLPAAVCGIAMVGAVYWLASMWFGRVAGLFAACVVAGSDFHILYSGMALTDVPCLLFITLAVGMGSRAVVQQRVAGMAAAGLLCGIAWWFKYSGWLPVAIVGSGSGLWWLLEGRSRISFWRLLRLQAVMAAVALLVWAPWLWSLQEIGGYAAVSANHAGYAGGFSEWEDRLTIQLANLFITDGLPAIAAIAVGMIAAAGHRWLIAERSTWNSTSRLHGSGYPPASILARFMFAAVAAAVISLVVQTPLMLACFAAGGLAGMLLWPVLSRMWRQTLGDDSAATAGDAGAWLPAEAACAPRTDPLIGQCCCVTWIGGLLLTTPLYTPYPRLMLPLLTGIWLAAAGGVAWWVEANLSVARRAATETGESKAAPSKVTVVMMVLMMAGVALTLASSSIATRTFIFASRTSLATTADDVIALCTDSESESRDAADPLPSGSVIRPEDVADRAAENAIVAAEPANVRGDFQKPVLIYAYGEPALLFHLHRAGISGRPVSHLNLSPSAAQAERIDSYLVVGPNAKRTPGFWDEWLSREGDFRRIGEASFYPSVVTLLNLFSPGWLREHPESQQQSFEVYRILPQADSPDSGGD